MNNSCASCFFYKRTPTTERGECHRNPPSVYTDKIDIEGEMLRWSNTSVWPPVSDRDYCGEYSYRSGFSFEGKANG